MVIKELGRGVSGVVYLARLPGIGLSAVKQVSMLSTEHYSLQRASGCPHAVRLLGTKLVRSGRLLFLELVEGVELFHLINRGPLPIAAIRFVMRQLLDALDDLHNKRGIVHGDLKPENIMVGRDYRVKLVDFGQSRPVACTTGAFGSQQYAPPEMRGGMAQCDPVRAEMYCLGLVLHAMLYGTLPGHQACYRVDGDGRALRQAMQALLNRSPGQRPVAARLKAHFGNYD